MEDPKGAHLSEGETGDQVFKPNDPVVCVFRQELNIFCNGQTKSALQFPEVLSSYSRLQLHHLVQNEFADFQTLSFGKGKHRCCVVFASDKSVASSVGEAEEESPEETVRHIKRVLGPAIRLVRPLTKPETFDDVQHGCVAANTDADLSHIVELYGFPVSHKTRDLDAVLRKFRTTQFYEIVWVDDTHALAVMNNKESAEKVLQIEDPAVKIQPFNQASEQSKAKAKAVGLDAITGQKKRPKTSMVAANRLLSRALGLPAGSRLPRSK